MREGGYLISQIHQLSGRIFSKKRKEYRIDINHAQSKIIIALLKKDKITITDLARETSLSKSSLTNILERLEKSGHLFRAAPDQDKRMTLICLAKKSSRMRSDYHQISENIVELFIKD